MSTSTYVSSVPAVSTRRADEVAADHSQRLSALLTCERKGAIAAQKCSWRLITLDQLPDEHRAAVAWIVADEIIASRCKGAPSYARWRSAALAGVALTDRDRATVEPFISPVFGTPESPRTVDHVQGYVAEWLWYLLMCELVDDHRRIKLLEPPKFAVTEPGPDGFVVYEVDGQPLFFRLWELKKHTGKSPVSVTVSTAYAQLGTRASQYIAQLTSIHGEHADPDVRGLSAQLMDLWIDSDPRAGVGVGVTSGQTPPPKRCFTTMGKQFDKLDQPGQLEGMLCAVESFGQFAETVRGFVWSAL